MVPFYVTSKLYQSVILGSEFLMSQKVSIDFGKSKLRIHRKNQLRTCTEITVPPRSQSLCEVRIKNYLPSGVIGHCHGGRNIQNIGLVVANTISSSRMTDFGTKVTVMVMNPSEVPVTIFPRTKIGTFNIVEENNISVLTNFDKIEPNTNISHEVTNPQCSFSGQEVLDKINISSSSINLTQQQQLKALINSYADVFETAKSPRGFYDKVEHRIDIGNNPPVRSRPYRHSPRLQQTIREHVNKMLNDGIISESTSPFSSPVVMVTKKTGEYIFCIDFRRLNQITVRDNFPLPSISDTFNNLGMTKPAYFSTLDMASGYWQIGLDRDSKKKTAFITQDGLYEFNVLPFGLHNAPSTFQRTMHEVLRGLHWKFCLVYLDDIIIYSDTFKDHLDHLCQVFQKFRDVNLKLKPKKCSFACDRIHYLGHIISEDGVATDPEKLKVVQEYPSPKNVKDVRAFLGFVGYYRRYIKDFSKIAQPLTALTRKDIPFQWTKECSEAFEQLKQKLLEPPVLSHPRFDEHSQFVLQTDASFQGLGFVLSQIQDGNERAIAYASRALKPAERNYTVTELEALAVVEGVKKLSTYLEHSPKFKIVTDHQALKWLFDQKRSSGRLARWSLYLQSYSYDIEHRPGKKLANVDTLSRICKDNYQPTCVSHPPVESSHIETAQLSQSEAEKVLTGLDNSDHEENLSKVDEVRNLRYQRGKRLHNQNMVNFKDHLPDIHENIDLDKIKRGQQNDSFSKPIIDYLESDVLPEDNKLARRLLLEVNQYFVHNGILYHVWHTPRNRRIPERNIVQLYIPSPYIDTVLHHCHDLVLSAHFGFHRTYSKIRQRYFWKFMHRDIDNWVRSCDSCHRVKTPKHKVVAPLLTMKVPGPFQRVSVDILGPLPVTESGNRYVLCFMDHCTRWPILVPIAKTDSATVATVFFKEIICNHGCPLVLLSDRGTNF